jgi:peptidoglycan/LPS O-acetylase OafA/YrhL
MVVLGPKLRRIGLAALALALIVFAWRSLDAHFGWFIPFATSVDSKTDTRINAFLWGCLAAIVYPYVHPRVQALPFGRSLWVPIAAVLAVVLILKHVPGGKPHSSHPLSGVDYEHRHFTRFRVGPMS